MNSYGLIGKKLPHSFSPIVFERIFKEHDVAAKFNLYEIDTVDKFTSLIASDISIKGVSVTIPYKETIMPLLTSISKEAESIQAVNSIKIIRHADKIETIGYNTDVFGFEHSIKPFLEMHHQRALIIGTGGASKSVYFALKRIGIDCLFVSRTPQKTNQIAYNQLNKFVIDNHPLIVNASPVGTYPNIDELPNIPYEYITDKHLCYDLVYNPNETQFMLKSKQMGAMTMNGWQMLNYQAEKSWELWNFDSAQ